MRRITAMMTMVAISISGCTTTIVTSAPSGPIVNAPISDHEAGVRFLSAVCSVNSFNQNEFAAALNTADLTAIRKAAGAGREKMSLAAGSLSASSVTWPTSVADDVKVVAKGLYGLASYYDGLSHADSLQTIALTTPPSTDEGVAASQSVRGALKLGADTTASCANRTN